MEPEEGTRSSFATATATPPPRYEPLQDYCGYRRSNMIIAPANERLGWVPRRSQATKPDNFVDFLLAPFTNQYSLHYRHCRLRRLLQSGVVLAVSDSRKVT
jgi:hypothetical protein